MATRTISNAGGAWNTTGAWVEGVVAGVNDDVVATATSGNLSLTDTRSCRSMDLTGYTGTFTLAANLTVGTTTLPGSGVSLKWVSGMGFTFTSGIVSFNNSAATLGTVDFGGKTVGQINVTANVQLVSAVTCTSLTHSNRHLDTNGQSVTCTNGALLTSGATARTLSLGTSTITAGHTTSATTTFGYTGSNCTLNAASSRYVVVSDCNFDMNSATTWGDIVLQGRGDQGSNSFNSQIRNPGTCVRFEYTPTTLGTRGSAQLRCTLPVGSTLTVTTELIVTGYSRAKRCLLTGGPANTQENDDAWTSPTTQTTIALGASGTATLSNCDLMGIAITGTATPITPGSGVSDARGNSGVTFDAARTLYWVGGASGGTTNTWGDSAHWSLTNGGTGGELCPLAQDTAMFTTSSGFTPGSSAVLFESTNVGCAVSLNAVTSSTFRLGTATLPWFVHDLTSVGGNQFTGNANNRLGMRPWTGETMNVSGATFGNALPVRVNGGGTVRLLSNVANGGQLLHYQGTIALNGFTWTVGGYAHQTTNTKVMDFTGGGVLYGGTITFATAGFSFVNAAQGQVGTSAATLTTAGLTMPGLLCNSGGNLVLGDNYTTAADVTIVGVVTQTVTMTSRTITCRHFIDSQTGTQAHTLNMTSATINCESFRSTGLQTTLTLTSSTINVAPTSGDSLLQVAASTAFNVVTLSPAAGSIIYLDTTAASTFATLTITGPAATDAAVGFLQAHTVTGTFTSTGNSPTNVLTLYGPRFGGVTALSAATASISDSNFVNVLGTGAASWPGGAVFTGWMNHVEVT